MKQRRYGASLAAFSMSALLFGAIAVRVIAIGPVCTIDSTAMIWAHVQAAPWLTDVMLGVTYLGGPSATSVYAFVLVGYLLWRRRFSMALILPPSCTEVCSSMS